MILAYNSIKTSTSYVRKFPYLYFKLNVRSGGDVSQIIYTALCFPNRIVKMIFFFKDPFLCLVYTYEMGWKLESKLLFVTELKSSKERGLLELTLS